MKTIQLAGQQIIRAALIVSMLLGGLPSAGAQQKSPVEAQKSAKAKGSGGQQEGIKVHGHWSIDIRNPDGSLASHSEFENAMVDNGQLLTGLLNGGTATGWQIDLQGTLGSSNAPCSGPPGCQVGTTKSIVTNSLGQQVFQLQGNVTANQDGRIERVATSHADLTGKPVTFTQKTLDPADQKAIVNGQIIQVTVGISFS